MYSVLVERRAVADLTTIRDDWALGKRASPFAWAGVSGFAVHSMADARGS